MILLLFFPGIAGAAPRPPWISNRVIGSPNPPAPYAVERAFPKLTFDHPTEFLFQPGSDRLFVAEQGGKLWSFDTRSNDVAKPELVIDLRKHHKPFDNILGFAFHPGFATNRFIFINYNEPGERENGSIVSRFTLHASTPPTLDPTSERMIIRWLSGGHNGCTLAFGNDGFLYISTGDAADPDPPDSKRKTGQDISDLLACILRIDVDRAEGANAYAIPRDNPFRETPGARPEVWAFGFRNPFRMSFDPPTGDLWVGDVGWELWEMIYRVQRGGNYGWALTEGPNLNVRTDVKAGPGPILPALIALPHTEAASITGGRVYQGRRLAKLRGAYIYGDWETGRIWALRHKGGRLSSNLELCDTALKIVSFAGDRAGELLVLDYNGGLYRIVPNAAPPANRSFPRRLSQTGLFASLQPLTPAPGTAPYHIAAPMWNDHATAHWLLGVPGDAAIATAGGVGNIAGATWFFPSNTVLARTLTLEMKSGEPASARRIETQLLHWDGQAWNPHTYRWRADQTEADLVPGEGASDRFSVVDARAPGGRRETPWRFASRAECLRCHNAWAGETLTLNWPQLANHGVLPTGGERRSTEWHRLEQLGVLTVKEAPKSQTALANPADGSRDLAERARSWLHVNCATCHRFGAGGSVAAQFTYDQSLQSTRAVDVKPTRGDFGLTEARIIAPGDPYRSTVFYRICTEGAGRMPHIGSRLVDEAGARLVRDWIFSLGPRAGQASNLVANTRWAENFGSLLTTMSGALQLLDVMTIEGPSGTDLPALRARAEVLHAAQSHTNALVRDLFQRLLPPSQRRQTLGAEFQPQAILTLKGNSRRGREIFIGASQCSQCHVCGGAGRNFGPELAGFARKYKRAELLDHILRPSKAIAPEFKTTTLLLRNDTELSGFIVRRNPTELTLRDAALNEHRVKPADVKDTRESALSAMPEGLLAPLTAQEAADLIEYLLKP